jgi:hypothetical protein
VPSLSLGRMDALAASNPCERGLFTGRRLNTVNRDGVSYLLGHDRIGAGLSRPTRKPCRNRFGPRLLEVLYETN